jgi:hypothetical protein
MKNRLFVTTITTAISAFTAHLNAQPKEFVPFKSFVDNTRAANSSSHMMRQESRVKDTVAFEEMRQHILTMYRGVEVKHSFVRDSSHFDCVPIEQQPTVKILGLQNIASAPPQSMLARRSEVNNDTSTPRAIRASQIPEKPYDEFGNSLTCEANTVPIRRITLEEMTQFPTLHQFFEKKPGAGNGSPSTGRSGELKPAEAPADSRDEHKYSEVRQNVDNLGGSSTLNLWSPYVNTAVGQIFSLSQEWYTGGSGPYLQTAEVGWQNYPAKYGSENSRLFIYWTADNYNQTGCYNLECAAFVQISDAAPLGGGFSDYSTTGGAQYEFTAQFYLYQGNWWLSIEGTWAGYYPGYIYNGGQLSYNAQTIAFGTESVGTTLWPQEGSGAWSNSDFGYAAYQRGLFYTDISNQAYWDTLTALIPSPSCYNISGPFFSSSSDWGAYFYEGGPGGFWC